MNQIMDNIFKVACDIGNSRIKICRSLDEIDFIVINTKWKANIIKFINKQNSDNIVLIYSSSNPSIEVEFISLLSSFNIEIINAKNILEKQSNIEYKHIKGIGIDRVLGLDYLSRYSKCPLVTIDCGTALTINVIDNDKKCLGGAILPGLYTQIKSLRSNTSSLPVIEKTIEFLSIGKNTEEAILVGTLNGLSGGVIKIIEEIELNVLKQKIDAIYITGAYANEISMALQKWNFCVSLQSNLILKSLLHLLNLNQAN